MTLLVIIGLISTVGCATKEYVRNQVTPINNKIDELNDITAKNTQGIKDADSKADQGINAANARPESASLEFRHQANQGVARVWKRRNGLQGTVENLDNYKPAANTTIQFATNNATLTKADQQMLDEFAQQIASRSTTSSRCRATPTESVPGTTTS